MFVVRFSRDYEDTFKGIKVMDMLRIVSNKFTGWCAVIIFIGIAACSEDDGVSKGNDEMAGAVRPVGAALGEVEYFETDAAGGIIKSVSGEIEINIPEGALLNRVTIGLQAVVNTAPNGSGRGYRITPHDIVFQKPVTISMLYSDSVSFVDGVGIAFQDEAGIWYWPGVVDHDRETRRVSTATTHFSDWAIIESSKLAPADAVIGPGEELTLQVLGIFPVDEEEYLLTPLVPVERVPLREPTPVNPSFIKQWKLQGEGSLAPSGNTAIYKAPGNIPETNPVVVMATLTLPSGSTWTLMSKIIIGGCEIMFEGGPYAGFRVISSETGVAGYDASEGVTVIYCRITVNPGETIGITIGFPGKGTGRRAWDKPVSHIVTAHHSPSRDIAGTSELEGDESHAGFTEVTRYQQVGGTIIGWFEGNLTFLDTQCNACESMGSVRGRFTAMRHY